LKQAKEEAAREVAMYKQELEAQYAESVDADASENASSVERLREESDAEISQVSQSMVANKQRVLDMLLTQVKTVGGGVK
jgi:V-type H+-transporting ATPase subunit G